MANGTVTLECALQAGGIGHQRFIRRGNIRMHKCLLCRCGCACLLRFSLCFRCCLSAAEIITTGKSDGSYTKGNGYKYCI